MRTKKMNNLVFHVIFKDLTPLICIMRDEVMEYVRRYYPNADIQTDVDFNIVSWLNMKVFKFYIQIHYYDAEINEDGGKIFNTSVIEYDAQVPEDLLASMSFKEYWNNLMLDFRFTHSNLNDDMNFLPTRDMKCSFENKLMNYLYKKIFWKGKLIC